jgi:putative acetyltransferase
MNDLTLRRVRPEDDADLARIIRSGMAEFGICGAGLDGDAEVASISSAYAPPRAAYFVVESSGRVLGGGGIGPIADQPEEICELRKMYLVPEARGLGAGRRLLETCLDFARQVGYRTCYLATLERMTRARRLYAGFGFDRADRELPGSAYLGCDTWYERKL